MGGIGFIKMKIEVCVDSVESCLEAIKGGANRLELCSSLFLGGLTPSYGLMKVVRSKIPKDFPVFVMIRPRSGDFLYNRFEIDEMKQDIQQVKELGYQGVVYGVLDENGNINKPVLQELIAASLPLQITFHRAFDMVSDYHQSLIDILHFKEIQRILTSGLESSVLEGLLNIKEFNKILKQFHSSSSSSLIIVPGGGITERNLSRISSELGEDLKEFHISGRVSHDSLMKFRNTKVFMGGELRSSEYTRSIVDNKRISSFINQIQQN